jgi:1-phosphofructokinase family hexose kinase
LDASVVLQTLGARQVALSFMAGAVGRQLQELLDHYGVPQDTVWVEGETRVAHVIVETDHQRHSHIMTGKLSVDEQQYAEYVRRFTGHLFRSSWVVTGGSLPQGLPANFYGILAETAQQAGVPMLVDASGPPILAMLRRCRPAILKMNRGELAETFGLCPGDLSELAACAAGLRSREALPALVLTCGPDGILAFTKEGAWLAAAPPQTEVNAAGAGDAVSAALPYRLSLGDPWPEALRWAAATSAAAVLTPGTADCRMEDVTRILRDTTVRSLT